MKKLMIAAVSMASIAGVADLCTPETVADGCSVYNVKFTFKTLIAKTECREGAKWLVTDYVFAPGAGWNFPVWYRDAQADLTAGGTDEAREAGDYIANAATTCWGNNVSEAARRLVYWLDNSTRKFDGILWQCQASCFEGVTRDCDAFNNGRINYALWEKKTQRAMSYPIFQVKIGNDDGAGNITDIAATEYVSFDQQNRMWLGRYGNKAQKVAAYWTPQLRRLQSIDAAGFGSYDVNNLRIKSISGNAVGMLAPVNTTTDKCGNNVRFFCAVGLMCINWRDWCCDGCYVGVELVPASGTWSLKYNASATKKSDANRTTLRSFVPDYMFYTHADYATARAADPWLHPDNYYWVNNATGALFYFTPEDEEGEGEETLTLDQALEIVATWNKAAVDFQDDAVPVYEKDEDGKRTFKGYNYYGLTVEGEDQKSAAKALIEALAGGESEEGEDAE